MKRMLKTVMVLLLFLMAGVQTQRVNAGWTDLWCVGAPGVTEICINSSGYLIPGASGTQNIGSASYPFSVLHLNTLTLQTGLTAPTATIEDALYLGAIATRSSHTAAGNLLIHGDVDVGDDARVVGLATIGETLNVTGDAWFGAIAYKSTITAASGDLKMAGDIECGDDATIGDAMDVVGALTAGTMASDASVSAVTSVSGATGDFSNGFDIDGQLLLGAIATKSTVTAAGNMLIHGDIDVGDDIRIVGLGTIGETLDVVGNMWFGAAGYRSTYTAASGDLAVGGDISLVDDLTVGDAALIPGQLLIGAIATRSTHTSAGALLIHDTINAGGAITSVAGLAGTTGDFSGNLTAASNAYFGAIATRSSHSAAGVLNIHDDVNVGDDLNVSGLVAITETLDVTGNMWFGAAGFRSTYTAASGDLAIGGDISLVDDLTVGDAALIPGQFLQGAIATRSTMPAAGSPSFNGTVSASAGLTAGTVVTGATGDFSSSFDIDGEVILGAIATKSTVTTTGNASFAGAVAAGSTLTAATNIIATAGFVRLYSRSQAEILAIDPVEVGEAYYCNDCTVVTVCVSTGTAVRDFASAGDRTEDCD